MVEEYWRKRKQLEENKRKGTAGERIGYIRKTLWEGWNLDRTGHGHDYHGKRYNLFTGKNEEKYFEFKSSPTAPLTPLQKKMLKKKKVEVVREEPIPGTY
jgi:hypothetical protein